MFDINLGQQASCVFCSLGDLIYDLGDFKWDAMKHN